MSSWVHMTAVLVIDDDVNFDNLGSHAGDEYWHCCGSGESVASIIQKLLVAPHEDTEYAPVSDPIYHITWYGQNEEVEEERNVGICKEDLEAFVFPHGSEGAPSMTITPHMSQFGLSWHIVISGGLRDRTGDYLEDIKKWWEVLPEYFSVREGYIFASSFDRAFEGKIGLKEFDQRESRIYALHIDY